MEITSQILSYAEQNFEQLLIGVAASIVAALLLAMMRTIFKSKQKSKLLGQSNEQLSRELADKLKTIAELEELVSDANEQLNLFLEIIPPTETGAFHLLCELVHAPLHKEKIMQAALEDHQPEYQVYSGGSMFAVFTARAISLLSRKELLQAEYPMAYEAIALEKFERYISWCFSKPDDQVNEMWGLNINRLNALDDLEQIDKLLERASSVKAIDYLLATRSMICFNPKIQIDLNERTDMVKEHASKISQHWGKDWYSSSEIEVDERNKKFPHASAFMVSQTAVEAGYEGLGKLGWTPECVGKLLDEYIYLGAVEKFLFEMLAYHLPDGGKKIESKLFET